MMRKILGPPGTGKTTRLLHYAQTFLKLGTPIDKIGYFAFTKKAAGEAKERMLDQNPHINEKELFQLLKDYCQKLKKKIDNSKEKTLLKSMNFLKNKAGILF